MNKPITNGMIIKWILLLNKFNVTILDRSFDIMVDFLSRMKNDNINTRVIDHFPDEYIFAISTKNPWFADIANYLATGKFPPSLSIKERQRVIKTNPPYSWIE